MENVNVLYIVWKDVNGTGVPILDEQHRGIVSTINSFYYFYQEGHSSEALVPTIKMLEQYVAIHFKTEEELMRKVEYPGLEEHIKLHKVLEEKTRSIAREIAGMEDAGMVLKFLRAWWLNHINIEDKKYAPYMEKLLAR